MYFDFVLPSDVTTPCLSKLMYCFLCRLGGKKTQTKTNNHIFCQILNIVFTDERHQQSWVFHASGWGGCPRETVNPVKSA